MRKLLLSILSILVVTYSTIAAQLMWDPSSDVTGYKVYRSLGANTFSLIGNLTTTSFPITLDANQISRYYVTAVNSSGIESLPSLAVTNFPSFGFAYLNYEAESGMLVSPMAINIDINANQGKFIQSNVGNSGTAKYTLNIPYTDTYVIWCRVISASGNTDSFSVYMDGGTEGIYGTSPGGLWGPSWQWTILNSGNGTIIPRTFYLTSGQHTLLFRGREANTKLDKFIITNDRNVNTTSKILNP